MITVKRLQSGYWHIKGKGPCNYSQPPYWPCDYQMLERFAHPEASERFLHQAEEVAMIKAGLLTREPLREE